MPFPFRKVHGAGNDFVVIDNRSGALLLSSDLVQELCHRRLGIGADGVILLQTSRSADFRMRIFNADGSEAEMCGNGVRALYRFLQLEGIALEAIELETMERRLRVGPLGEEIQVEMGGATNVEWSLVLEGETVHLLDTGVPHLVLFVPDCDEVDLAKVGSFYRSHPYFPKGTNVNVASIEGNQVRMRTWERGVEGETLACGTGACAVGIAAGSLLGLGCCVSVEVKSGDTLSVAFERDLSSVTLTGPAVSVFKGIYSPLDRQPLLVTTGRESKLSIK